MRDASSHEYLMHIHFNFIHSPSSGLEVGVRDRLSVLFVCIWASSSFMSIDLGVHVYPTVPTCLILKEMDVKPIRNNKYAGCKTFSKSSNMRIVIQPVREIEVGQSLKNVIFYLYQFIEKDVIFFRYNIWT